jgi:hypothetical protein
MVARRLPDYIAPDGAWNFDWLGYDKYAAPTVLGARFRELQRSDISVELSAQPPFEPRQGRHILANDRVLC